MRRLAACALLLTLAGCNGNGAAPAAAPKAPAGPAVQCLPVAQATLDAIAEGAESDVGTITLSGGQAVKSPDHANVYLIAAHMSAAGVNEVGVWASNSLAPGGGLVMAADGIAKQFTVWPDADKTDAQISSADKAVGQAEDCT